jgi:hypothetical protein
MLRSRKSSHIDVCEFGLNPDTIVERLILAKVQINVTDDVPTRRSFVSNERHLGVAAKDLRQVVHRLSIPGTEH